MSFKKRVLVINGVERMMVCDPEDSLATALRNMGLTGTKVGCGTGQCGACSVILDGKVVRSCVRKMKAVKEYAVVTTIEGIGSADNLHPLQVAWMVHGGVQCGFCTPGFIVSAYALLQENVKPTREDVRDWFQKHRNACRCTGYKQLVDAVMDAAAVLRGEKKIEDLRHVLPESGRIYNSRFFPRPVALAKVLGQADFGDDIAVKNHGFLEAAMVLPGISHGNILSIDASEAEKAPGVVKVLTHKDVKGLNRIPFSIAHPRVKHSGMERPLLLDKKVFRWGDPVALVIAETREQARAAAKLVKCELEPLPEYLTAIETLDPKAVPIHPGIPPVYIDQPVFRGKDTREALKESAHVVEGRFFSTREPHMSIEPEVAQAYVDGEGVMTIHSKSLFLHLIMNMVPPAIGWPKEKIRIIENHTGASFGYSMDPHSCALVALAAMETGRPVNLTLNYEEHMHYTGKRAPGYTFGRIGCDKDGKLNAVEWNVLYDKGAYTALGPLAVQKGSRFFCAPYTIPNALGLAECALSNHAYSTAYRGFCSPQPYTASEQLMDMLAEKAGIDPLEFRYRNVYRDGDESVNGHKFSVYGMREVLDKLRVKYDACVARAEKLSTPEKKRGVGVCCGEYNVTSLAGDYCSAIAELNETDGVTIYSNWQDQGQGADIGALVNAHEAFKELGLSHEKIKLVMNDTSIPAVHGPSGGSRSHYMNGNAVTDAAKKLLNAMRKPDGTFRTHAEMVKEGLETKHKGEFTTTAFTVDLDPNTGQGNPSAEYSQGAFLAEVEVEIATGKTTVVAMHGVADVGVVGNYQTVEGQAYGGMSHTIGFALSEDYSDVKKHISLVGAGFPYIKDIPDGDDFTIQFVESPRPSNPFGSAGCAELFQSSGHTAVLNAIYNAVGVRIHDLPARPEKVKAGIDALAQGKSIPPYTFDLGDFYEKMDRIKANPVAVPEKK